MGNLLAFEDPNHEGNSSRHRTGKPCIEPGCSEPAGTMWSHLWCFDHNVERMRRIGMQLGELVSRLEEGPSERGVALMTLDEREVDEARAAAYEDAAVSLATRKGGA